MIMVDLETLGSAESAVIVSIGAVQFSLEKKRIGATAHWNIDPESNPPDRTMDRSTIKWWLEQSKEAQKALHSPRPIQFDKALNKLTNFIEKDPYEAGVWANGASFDLSILRNAYGGKPPWKYNNELCLRSIRRLGTTLGVHYHEYRKGLGGTKHNALTDAAQQVQYLLHIYDGIAGAIDLAGGYKE